MFKFGIAPKYEDPENQNGGDFNIFITADKSRCKDLWEAFIFDIVSQNFNDIDHLTGIRITEKQEAWKFEFWVTYCDYMKDEHGQDTYIYLKKKITALTGGSTERLNFNPHNQEKPKPYRGRKH